MPDGPGGTPPAGGRPAGWREVLLVAGVVLAVVLGLEVVSAAVPSVGDLFRGFPLTIVILVVGTVGLFALLAVRRPRR